jgi:hypothetical protein
MIAIMRSAASSGPVRCTVQTLIPKEEEYVIDGPDVVQRKLP